MRVRTGGTWAELAGSAALWLGEGCDFTLKREHGFMPIVLFMPPRGAQASVFDV